MGTGGAVASADRCRRRGPSGDGGRAQNGAPAHHRRRAPRRPLVVPPRVLTHATDSGHCDGLRAPSTGDRAEIATSQSSVRRCDDAAARCPRQRLAPSGVLSGGARSRLWRSSLSADDSPGRRSAGGDPAAAARGVRRRGARRRDSAARRRLPGGRARPGGWSAPAATGAASVASWTGVVGARGVVDRRSGRRRALVAAAAGAHPLAVGPGGRGRGRRLAPTAPATEVLLDLGAEPDPGAVGLGQRAGGIRPGWPGR